jgi:hypothetical protein
MQITNSQCPWRDFHTQDLLSQKKPEGVLTLSLLQQRVGAGPLASWVIWEPSRSKKAIHHHLNYSKKKNDEVVEYLIPKWWVNKNELNFHFLWYVTTPLLQLQEGRDWVLQSLTLYRENDTQRRTRVQSNSTLPPLLHLRNEQWGGGPRFCCLFLIN